MTRSSPRFLSTAEQIRNSCPDIVAVRLRSDLIPMLDRLRSEIVTSCEALRSTSKTSIENFKEDLHRAYVSVAEPFVRTGTYEAWFLVYSHMAETTEQCSAITGHQFDMGLEYSSLSVAEIGLGKFEQAFVHMELADLEDMRIGHTTGLARKNLEWIVDRAYDEIDKLVRNSNLTGIPNSKALCDGNLDWSEKCRLTKCLWQFTSKTKDNRSYVNNEALERGLSSLCKIVEVYLRRKNPVPNTPKHKQTLNKLVAHNFRSHRWFSEWNSQSQLGTLSYKDPSLDDARLVGFLHDVSKSYEANLFLSLCMIRNFSAHVFNDESDLFLEKNYEKAFLMCIEALMYTLNHVK